MRRLILILLVSGCVCFPPEEPVGEELSAPNVTGYFIRGENGSILYVTPIRENKTQVQYVTVQRINYVNRTLDVSMMQKKELMNLKPHNCHTACCNDGYFKAKWDMMDLFGWESGRSRESPSNNFDELYKEFNETFLPIRYADDVGYIALNRSLWAISQDDYTIVLRIVNKSESGSYEVYNRSYIREDEINMTCDLRFNLTGRYNVTF